MIVSGYPIIWMTTFYAYMLRLRMQLGHWPVPMIDGNGVTPNIYEKTIMYAMPIIPISIVMTIFTIIIKRRKLPRKILSAAIITTSLSVASVVFVMMFDPMSCVEWFLD
jgi:hypothetical protein